MPLTTRGPDGQLRDVPLLNANIAEIQTSGVDFNVNYAFEVPGVGGTFDYRLSGAHILENTFRGSPVINPTDCAGFVGGGACSFADAEWRAVQRFTWGFDVSSFHCGTGISAASKTGGSPPPRESAVKE